MPTPTPEYCLLWIDHWSTCMQKSEWSGWAQAIVSTIAVVAAAAGIWWQIKHQSKLQREQATKGEVLLLKIVGQFVFEVRAKLRMIEEEDLPARHGNWTAIESPIESIEAVSFDRYPDERAAFATSKALLSYRFMRAAYAKRGSALGTADQSADIDESRRYAVSQFLLSEQAIEAALVARASKLPLMRIGFEDGSAMRTLEADPVTP